MTPEDGDPVAGKLSAADRSPTGVREVYDDIAEHFAQTRAYPWPEVEAFVGDCDGGGVALDIGCANGRHAELLAEDWETVLALDVSFELLLTARDRLREVDSHVHLLQGDAASLPLADDSVETALYIATIHHLPDRETRRQSLGELARVLEPGGDALVSAWSRAHDRFETDAEAETGFDTSIDWTLPGGEERARFYHIYALPEFETDLRAGGLAVESAEISSGNCYARVRPK